MTPRTSRERVLEKYPDAYIMSSGHAGKRAVYLEPKDAATDRGQFLSDWMYRGTVEQREQDAWNDAASKLPTVPEATDVKTPVPTDLMPWLGQTAYLLNLYLNGYCPKDVARNLIEKIKYNWPDMFFEPDATYGNPYFNDPYRPEATDAQVTASAEDAGETPKKDGNDNIWTRPATIKGYRDALGKREDRPAPPVDAARPELPISVGDPTAEEAACLQQWMRDYPNESSSYFAAALRCLQLENRLLATLRENEGLTPCPNCGHWTEGNVGDFVYSLSLDFFTQLGDRIHGSNMQQKELAERLDVSPSAVSQMLNSPPSKPELETLVKYARAVGSKVSVVLYNDDDPSGERGPIYSGIFERSWEALNRPRDLESIEEALNEITALRAELDAIRERTEKAVEWLEHPASLKTVEVHNALRALKGK